MKRTLCICGLVVFVLSANTGADVWPGFRGEAGSGVSGEKGLPAQWSESENLAWKRDLPGRGNSSPAVTTKRIYLTTQTEGNSLYVVAINRKDGSFVWQKKVGAGTLAAKGSKNLYAHRHNAATPSPSADEEHVWAFFGTGLLVCLDSNGEEKWRRNMVEAYGAYDITFGMGSSPRLWGDNLFLCCITKGASYVAAIDKASGKEVWKTDRKLPAKDDGADAYSTPAIWETKRGTSLVVAGADHVDAYDLKGGKQLWVSGGLTIDSQYGRVIASPAVSESAVVVASGNPLGGTFGRTIALRPGGRGDITQSHRMWSFSPHSPDSPSPVIYQSNVYLIRDDGIATCLDLKTVKTKWQRRMGKGPYRASVVAGDGKVYFINRDGECIVMAAGDQEKELARNTISDSFYATPAISDGVIYLRGYKRLYAIK